MLNSTQITALIGIAKDAAMGVMKVYHEASPDTGAGECAIELSYKAEDSPVTVADLLAHRIIVEGLVRIALDIPVVSEEDSDSMAHRTAEGRFWMIDPLDGTKEFISRNGEFTINIALIENGLPVFGIVLAPCLDLLYWGGKGVGAFREINGVVESIVPVDSGELARHLRVVASRSHMNADTTRFIERLGTCELIQAGSSLKLCRVAEGSADVYPRLGPTSEWDTAAAQAIVEAAGGHVLTLSGEPLRYGKPEILNPSFVVTNKRSLRHVSDM